MPKVPTYGTRRIANDPLPDVRRTAAETALSQGAGVEQAKADKGEAIAGFGQGLTNMGRAFGAIVAEERAKADDIANLEASNRLARWKNKRMYDPEAGALAVRGKDSQALPEQVGGEFEKEADEIAA